MVWFSTTQLDTVRRRPPCIFPPASYFVFQLTVMRALGDVGDHVYLAQG